MARCGISGVVNGVDVLQVLHIWLQCLSFSFNAMHTPEL